MIRVCAATSVHQAFDARIFHKQCKSLVRAGFNVSLIAPHDRDDIVDGVTILAIPRIRNRLLRAVISTAMILWRAYRVNARIYHFHDPELIPAGLVLKALGKATVFDVHEDYPKAMLSKHYLPRWARPLAAFIARALAALARNFFNALVSATPSIATTLGGTNRRHIIVQNYPEKTEFGLREPICEKMWAQRRPCVAYIGGISEIRGIVEILDALARLSDESSIKLSLAGSFAPSALQRQVVCHPGWKRVDWLGQVSRADVAVLLQQVRAGLVLFKEEPNHLTAYPTKMFEYMSAGIPVIVSDFPLWRRIVEEAKCGLVVDPTDSAAVARAIEHVVTHEADAIRMGRAGMEAVTQQYNWALEERKLVNLYRDLTANL